MPWTTTLLRTLRFRTTTTTTHSSTSTNSSNAVRKQGGDQEDVEVLVVPSAAAAASATTTTPLKASTICRTRESSTATWEDAVARLFRNAVAPSHSSCGEEEKSLGITNLQHMRQRTNWDCGVTCLQMVAHWLASNDATTDFGEREEHRRDWMLKLAGTASIWTVDLAWILHNMMMLVEASQRNDFNDFSFLFCSTSLSVNEEFSDYNYYKEAFAKDRIRVLERFQRLGEIQDPPVLFQTSRQRLPLSRVVEFIQQSSCIGITLVDNQILKGNTGKPYTGHYVVLLGVSHDFIHVREAVQHDRASSHEDIRFCLVVSDPGSKQSESFYTPNHFDRAWRSPGTDDDIIFVVKR